MATTKKESWKVIHLAVRNAKTHYAVSNLGRVCSYHEEIGDGKILGGTIVNGYPALKLKINQKDFQFYIHKLVAEYFLKKTSRSQIYVLHLDHEKTNNKLKNLKWANKAQMEEHQQNSPNVQAYRERTKLKGHKLTAVRVKQIKVKIADTKRRIRMKDIARQFGISEMQLYRIKSGENWGHVK